MEAAGRQRRLRRRRAYGFGVVAIAAAAIVALPALARTSAQPAARLHAGSGSCSSGSVPVDIQDFQFEPDLVVPGPEMTVCWTNSGSVFGTRSPPKRTCSTRGR